MKRLAALAAACALLAGCAAPAVQPMATALGDKPTVLAAPVAMERLVPGTTTRADVQALLGATRSVRFDSALPFSRSRLKLEAMCGSVSGSHSSTSMPFKIPVSLKERLRRIPSSPAPCAGIRISRA